jgi:hypothetical protein
MSLRKFKNYTSVKKNKTKQKGGGKSSKSNAVSSVTVDVTEEAQGAFGVPQFPLGHPGLIRDITLHLTQDSLEMASKPLGECSGRRSVWWECSILTVMCN